MRAILIYIVLVACAIQGATSFAESLKLDYAKYKIESACAMKQVALGIERRDVNFALCKEITWKVGI